MLKKISLLLCIFAFSTAHSEAWLEDFETAKKQASTHSKPILLVFQGSDWCAPCRKMDKRIFTTDIFLNHAQKNYILLKADFPRKSKNQLSTQQKQANQALAERYNKQAYFPFVVLLDHTGKKLWQTGYSKLSPEKFVQKLDSYIKL